MTPRILVLFLLTACGGGPLDHAQGESNGVSPTDEPEQVVEAPVRASACDEAAARLAVVTLLRNPVIRVVPFESDERSLVALLSCEEFGGECSLRLTMGECVDDEWLLASPIAIGVIGRESTGDPGRYDRAEVGLSAVELSGDSRAVQITWRHIGTDRRSVRWFSLPDDGPVDLGECTTRDLRSIDASSFLQGHEVRAWRVIPGTPPRLVGERVAGGGHLDGSAMIWSDRTDERSLDVPLVAVEPELSELCL